MRFNSEAYAKIYPRESESPVVVESAVPIESTSTEAIEKADTVTTEEMLDMDIIEDLETKSESEE